MAKEAFHNLNLLGQERLAVLESRMIRGDKYNDIAQMIQSDWKQCLDVSLATLAKQLLRYNEKVIGPRVAITVKSIAKSSGFKTSLRKIEDHLDVLEDLYQLADTQKARLQRLLEKEGRVFDFKELAAEEKAVEKTASKDKEKDKEFKYSYEVREEFKILLAIYNQMGHYQLETGVMRRTPKVLKGVVKIDPNDPSRKKFELSIQDRDELLERGKKIGSLLEGDFSVLEKDEPVRPMDPGTRSEDSSLSD